MTAANSGSAECIDALVVHSANINALDEKGYTALIFAASSGCEQGVRTLLAHGADPRANDQGNKWDFTALHKAQDSGKPVIVALLQKALHSKVVLYDKDHKVMKASVEHSAIMYPTKKGNHEFRARQ